MHGDQRVEFLRGSHVSVRERQLSPDQQGHYPRQHKEEETCPDIQHSELLMVDRISQVQDPAGASSALLPWSGRHNSVPDSIIVFH